MSVVSCKKDDDGGGSEVVEGKLTITGLSEFDGKYVYVTGIVPRGVDFWGLKEAGDIEKYCHDCTYQLVKISGGKASMHLYWFDSNNDFTVCNRTGTGQFDVLIFNVESFKEDTYRAALEDAATNKRVKSYVLSFEKGGATIKWGDGLEAIDPAGGRSGYTWPANFKMEYNYAYPTTFIRIGENYYSKQTIGQYSNEHYLQKGAGAYWTWYEKEVYSTTWKNRGVRISSEAFDKIENEMTSVAHYYKPDADVTGENITYAERSCKKYDHEAYGIRNIHYIDTETNLCLYHEAMDMLFIETFEFDTTVTGFGDIDLPN
jgi:hypothetical protein